MATETRIVKKSSKICKHDNKITFKIHTTGKKHMAIITTYTNLGDIFFRNVSLQTAEYSYQTNTSKTYAHFTTIK